MKQKRSRREILTMYAIAYLDNHKIRSILRNRKWIRKMRVPKV